MPAALSAIAVVIIAAIGAVVLLRTGGKPAARARNPHAQIVQLTNAILASRQLYAATQQPGYSALLPAGWQQTATPAGAGVTAATTVLSPVDGGATITVGQVPNPPKRLGEEAAAMLRAAASGSGFHQDASAPTTLAGGRSAWVLAYDDGGLSHATYVVRSCGNVYAISTTVPPSRVSLLRERVEIVASTLQGNC